MKRVLTAALLAVLMLACCHAFAGDTDCRWQTEPMNALREEGRETGNVLASAACPEGDTPDTAVFLVRAGDTAQLTALEKTGDESWRITGQNDTLPVSVITSASLELWDSSPSVDSRAGRDWIRLEIHKYIPSSSPYEPRSEQGYLCLDFQRTPAGDWELRSACDIPFEDAEEGYCPYHLLTFTDDAWVYRFFEEIFDESGFPADRSEMILRKTVPAEKMAPYTALSQFDYPSFLAFLRALAPEEYEHAPRRGRATVPPPPVPTAVPEENAEKTPDYVYYNPAGGRYYHAGPECASVAPAYLPLTPVPFDEIGSGKFARLEPCPKCGAPERPAAKAAESILKAVAPGYGDTGLKDVWILMNTTERQAYILESFPPYCYLDPDRSGDAIRIDWYPDMVPDPDTQREPYGERWSMTFEFTDGTWRLTSMTNGISWTARADRGVYTFDDRNDPGGAWQWKAEFEDRLTDFDYAGIRDLVGMYNAAMPDRPSLRGGAAD